MLGAGRLSSWWGYTGDIGTVAQHVPSCIVCEQDNNQFLVTDNNCRRCTNWETCGDYPLLRTPIPKNYPSELVQNHEAFLTPKKLTYDMLQGGVLSSHANFVHGDWDAEEVKQYLYSLSINKDAIQSVLKHAQNARAIKLLTQTITCTIKCCCVIVTATLSYMNAGHILLHGGVACRYMHM
jgi:hypothetical protein